MKPHLQTLIRESTIGFLSLAIAFSSLILKPSLLLLHMTPRSSDEFRELMPILAEKRKVMAMDLMGLGDSDQPPRVYSVADYAKTVIALWEQLGLKKSSILGNLTGGYIAGELAAAYPERVNKLLLCNVVGFDEEERDKSLKKYSEGFKSKEGFKIKEDGSHLRERWLARVNYVGNGELNHRCVVDDLKCFGSPVYPGLAVTNYCLEAQERFRSIVCPTLILAGKKGLKALEKAGLAKAENQDWLTKAIPHSQRVELESGTLWMMNQMPEEIAKVVVNFLDNAGEGR